MANITAAMVKDLRTKSGAGMMDCKRALQDADGDMAVAMEALRKAGIAKAAKKASRSTTEGMIAVRTSEDAAVIIEVGCETDFVARNEAFQEMVEGIAERAMGAFAGRDGDITEDVREVENNALTERIGKMGENMTIVRVVRWEGPGAFSSYIHMGGKIGVLVETHGDADADTLKDLCMHIAAFQPQFISPDAVSEEVVAKEREIAAAQVAGKPANIIEKIVDGKMGKWFSEVCLVRQPWIRDDKSCLEKIAPKLTIDRFVRWAVGENAVAEDAEED